MRYQSLFTLLLMIAAASLSLGALAFFTGRYRRYLGISRRAAAGLFFLSLAGGLAAGAYRVWQLDRELHIRFNRSDEWPHVLTVVCTGLLVAVAIPFAAKLYLKWIGGQLTDAEKAPGAEGVRAWLRGGNLFCALLISVCAAQGFGVSFWSVLALTLLALLIYPLMNFATLATAPAAASKHDPTAGERERVLKMLDEGKITAHESAELLNALSLAAHPAPAPTASLNPSRKLVLAGLVILLLGFFLPWFSYNPGQEANRMVGEFQNNIGQVMPAGKEVFFPFGPAALKTPTVRVAGGEIRYGLGWVVVLLGIAAASLPFFAGNMRSQDQFKATLAGLALGALVMLYLLTQNMRYVSIGLLLAMVGYALQFVGTLKERQWRHA